ncbi:MAG TPA: AI-2E family transporter [Thermoleophilaceae bacterium]|nr:AI-2E family transporter [Thermoleophilaceae bacterium]
MIARTVFTVVLCVAAVYLVYLLRTPIAYVVLAAFIAACASGPVNALARHMKRGAAVGIVYLLIVLVPAIFMFILVRPVVEQTVDLLGNLPEYAQDLEEEIQSNEQLRELDEDYDLTGKIEDLASNLASKLDDAAAALVDVGAGVVSSLFALVTILVLSMFMLASAQRWRDAFLATRPPRDGQAWRRATDEIATAVSSYVGGALFQATVAGIVSWLMLVILGIPSPLPLALIIALLDLIPMVGATIGAVAVGVVILFSGSTGDVLIWALFAIAYQQFENYVVQPRIQSKAVSLDPFIVVIAALVGGTLLGVVGALLAIPGAATIKIALREWLNYTREAAPAVTRSG